VSRGRGGSDLQRDDISDDYFGREAEGSEAVASFIEKQNALTSVWIPRGVRDAYLARWRTLIDYPRCSLPSHEGRYWTRYAIRVCSSNPSSNKQSSFDGVAEVLIVWRAKVLIAKLWSGLMKGGGFIGSMALRVEFC